MITPTILNAFPAHMGASVVRLKPLPFSDRFEVLRYYRDAWGHTGPFGAILQFDEALAFIADEPAFWIWA